MNEECGNTLFIEVRGKMLDCIALTETDRNNHSLQPW